MNHELLNAVRTIVINFANQSGMSLIATFKSVTEFQKFVVNLTVRFLVQSGFEIQAAFNLVCGDGSFSKLADDVWAKLNAVA